MGKIGVIIILLVIILVVSCTQQNKTENIQIEQENKQIQEGENMAAKKVVMIIAQNGFRDEELLEPKKVLESAGMKVVIASEQLGTAAGKLGAKVKVDASYTDVTASDYDAVVFIGGPGASVYLEDETAQALARETLESGKVLAAICLAPSILANAGLLEGKKATAFISEKGNLESHGAKYMGEGVFVDGKIVTASGPAYATKFGEKIKEMLK